jgi:hypothetical protein
MVKVMCLYKKFLFIYRQAQMARFASSNCYSNALNPYFITGFTDAEGSFHISMYISLPCILPPLGGSPGEGRGGKVTVEYIFYFVM